MTMTIRKADFSLEELTENHKNEIPVVYIPVFEDHPWHEEFECECGAGPYSLGCQREEDCDEFKTGKLFLISSNDQKCYGCGGDLIETLRPIFTADQVIDWFSHALNSPGFEGFAANRFGKLVGFGWGYDFPTDHPAQTGSTWYREAGQEILRSGASPKKCFYHNESGTLYAHQRKGIGTSILRQMLEQSRLAGHDFITFRTANPAMVRCYEKAFGLEKGSLVPSFSDPNPNKRQKWYIIDLKLLK